MKGDEKMRYQIIIAWSDCSCKSETVDELTNCLVVASIYMLDPDCAIIHIIDNEKEKMILEALKHFDMVDENAEYREGE